jgi:hypothetical protein
MVVRGRRALLIALLLTATVTTASAGPVRAAAPPPPGVEDEKDEVLPEYPPDVQARTGTIRVSERMAKAGDRLTATFSPLSGAVNWSMSPGADKGTKCTGEAKTDKEAISVPPGTLIGGPTSCTWTVGEPSNGKSSGWIMVGASIGGPCADYQQYLKGKYETYGCGSAHSEVHYIVLAKKQHYLYGQVVGKKGDPVSGVLIEITGDGKTVFVATDAQGYYKLKVKEGSYQARATVFDNPDYGYMKPDDFSPSNAYVHVSGPTSQDFTLEGFELKGTVRNDKKEPLGGLKVRVTNARSKRETSTQQDGTYSMTVPRDTYAVEVLSRPPKEPGRDATNWGIPYVCKAPGVTKKQRFCKIDVNGNADKVDFAVDLSVKVEVFVSHNPDAEGRVEASVFVSDAQGEPVGDQQVVFRPSRAVAPQMLICAPDGRRWWPPHGPPPTESTIADKEFTLTTDDQGEIQVLLWPGWVAGKWSLDVEPKDSTRKDEKATAELEVQRSNDPLPSADELAKRILLAVRMKAGAANQSQLLQSTGAFSGEFPRVTGDLALKLLSEKSDFLHASVSPLHTTDGKNAGLLFLAEHPSASTIEAVAASLANGGSSLGVPHFVLDAGELMSSANVGKEWQDVELHLVSLPEWARAMSAGQAPVAAGRYDANEDERRLTFFGWPTPPMPGSQVDRCAGIDLAGQQAEVHSPVRLTFTAADGRKVAGPAKAGGDPEIGIPGSWVEFNDKGEPFRYLLPAGTYDVGIEGTGKGGATVALVSGGTNEIVRAYHFDVKDGETGTVPAFADNATAPESFTFGTRTIKTGVGFAMTMTGVPKTVATGRLVKAKVKLVDEFGSPVVGGIVAATYDDVGYGANSVTGPDGVAELALLGPEEGKTLLVKATAPQRTPVEVKVGPAAPPFVASKDVKAAVGRPPIVDAGWYRELAWIPLLALAIGGAVYLSRRRRASSQK